MDVAQWLRNLNLGEYEAFFRDNHIDGSVLSALTNEDLKDLGIASVGHRRKLLEAIAALRAGAAAVGPNSDVAEEAERRQLTLMFCDLVGSTPLASRFDPEDLRDIFKAYHRTVTETIVRFDGFVAKYMGDGVLAYFGYPQAHEDDAERAVRAGLGTIDAVARLESPESLAVRIGIATGLVVVGDLIGEGAAQERGVVGETPHLAARLQALAAPNSLVVADATRRQVGSLFEFEDLGMQQLAGFAEPQHAWRIVSESGIVSRFEALRTHSSSQLVGREEEIEILLRRWARAKAGNGQIVLLSGEAGIGKSRLVKALEDRLVDQLHAQLGWFCSPHHQESPLYPLIAALERDAGFAREDMPERRLAKLEVILPSATAEETALIAALLSIPTGDRYPPLGFSPQRQRRKTLDALLARTFALSKERPMLLVFEDAHWIDPSSADLLALAAERVSRQSVLLIVTSRPGFAPSWANHAHSTVLVLNRLDNNQIGTLADLVGRKPLPAQVREQIVGRADGVPLFAEELTKTILESGLLKELDDRYALTDEMQSLTIPPTLHGSLTARLDRMSSARDIAQIGAALGREFSFELLRAVVQPRSDRELQEKLDSLVSAELLLQTGALPDRTYVFKHALVQDAAYSGLLRSSRRELHLRVGMVLETAFPDIADTQPELIAHHYTEAERWGKAVQWWRVAGRRAFSRAGNLETAIYLGRALELIEKYPEGHERDMLELTTRIDLGGPLILVRGYSASGENYERAWELCERTGSTEHAFPLLWGQFLADNSQDGIVERQTVRAKRFLDLAQRKGDAGLQVVGHRMLGVTLVSAGEFMAGRRHLERGVALYDPVAHQAHTFTYHVNPGISCRVNLSLPLQYLGFFDQAARSGEQGLAEARKSCHFPTMGIALHLVSRLRAFQREMERVRALASELVALSREHDATDWALVGEILLAWQAACSGDLRPGLEELHKCTIALRERAPSHNWLPPYLLLEAELYGEAGRCEDQLQLLDEVHRLMQEQGQPVGEPEVYRQRASALRARGAGTKDIDDCYQHSIEIARRQSAKFWELRAAVSRARFWGDQGKRREARELLAPVYGWFTEGFDTADLKEAKELLDELT
jgi:class 3 adenylate cyclase